MTVGPAFYFEGPKWRGVRAVEKAEALLSPRATEGLCKVTLFTLTSVGPGRTWETDRPLGFWRSFAALDLSADDPAPIVNFIRRHGDPSGMLDRAHAVGQPLTTETSSWLPFVFWLSAAARAWDPPDAEGVSRRTDDPNRLAEAWRGIRTLVPPEGAAGREYVLTTRTLETGPLVIRPTTLRSYMVFSAGVALTNATPMRRCLYCNDFFEIRRSGGVYCSASCQASHHQTKARDRK